LPTAAVLCFGILTFARNPVFQNSLRLWEDAVRKGDQFAFPHYNLGESYFEKGLLDIQSPDTLQGVRELHRSLNIKPDHPYAFAAHHRLGQYYLARSDLGRAVHHLEKSIMMMRTHAKKKWAPPLMLASIPVQFEEKGTDFVSVRKALEYLILAEEWGAAKEKLEPLRARLIDLRNQSVEDS
jgi:hypothetical protein